MPGSDGLYLEDDGASEVVEIYRDVLGDFWARLMEGGERQDIIGPFGSGVKARLDAQREWPGVQVDVLEG